VEQQLELRQEIVTAGSKSAPSEKDGMLPDECVKELRALILAEDKILLPGTKAYNTAVYTGNLLYSRRAPGAVIVPSTTEEIASIVSLARKLGITLTTKNGGNSFAGYCLNLGGIVIDLCRFKSIDIDDKANVVTIQGGFRWNEVYDILSKRNPSYIVIGGRCAQVGVSGYTLGGGVSPFSRTYGLGIDNVLEMTVVTAAGQILVLNDKVTDANQRDLFWALCGGGGGNFGILVEFKTKLHRLSDPDAKTAGGPLGWDLSDKDARGRFEAAMNVFNTREWPPELTIDTIWRYKDGKLFGEMMAMFDGNVEKCLEVLDPLIKFQPTDNGIEAMQWHKWLFAEQGFDVTSPIYHHHTSLILGQGAITPTVTKAITSLMEEANELQGRKGKSHFLWDMAGYKSTTVAPDATPYYWREGIYIAAFKLQWDHPSMTKSMLAFSTKIKATLMPHALEGKAAYLNYIDPTVKDWAYAYYGNNYSRLQAIKQHWDPSNFFHFDQSITLPTAKPLSTEPQVARMLAGPTVTSTLAPAVDPTVQTYGAEAEDEHRHHWEAVLAMWDKFCLSDPDQLWDMKEFDVEKFLMVIEGEIAAGQCFCK
jgi:hypothetical protein